MNKSFGIFSLSEKPEFADACAAWSFGEWGCQTADRTLENVQMRYRQTALNKTGGKLPQTWIAVLDDRPAGMISLKGDDHPDHKDLSPWLASLYIHSEYRGRGLAVQLIKTVENFAAQKPDVKRLYLFTHTASALYKREGWKEIKTIRDPSGLRTDGEILFAKDL